jgi:hypothetical protein
MVDVSEKGRSGHGFSTERREERRRMRSEFPRWGNERADESIPEPPPSQVNLVSKVFVVYSDKKSKKRPGRNIGHDFRIVKKEVLR